MHLLDICEQPDGDDYISGLKKRQIVLEFDKATWQVGHSYPGSLKHLTLSIQRAKDVFEITESKIPQRPPARTKLGDKWYG